MTAEGDEAFLRSAQAKAQAQLITRNAKAYASKVKAEAVRMPALNLKRKRHRRPPVTCSVLLARSS